jgi:hypothetical protein
MSDARAVAAVTATLKRLLFRAVSADSSLSGTQVTARPPDRARTEPGAGNQINLFLYRTSLDAAWRNQDPPGLRSGEQGSPALPLVLSYLLTAYGEDDDEVLSHRLLGLAMSVLHDRPVLSPVDIAAALPGTGLEAQVERVRITPHPIPMDEISRLWATFQTGYRISATYDAAVVLIDSLAPIRASMPVLSRGAGDLGPVATATAAPVLTLALAPQGRPGVRPGEQLVLVGRRLGGVRNVRIESDRLLTPRTIPADSATDDEIRLTVPGADPLPAGTVAMSVSVPSPTGQELTSNRVPVGLAPVLVSDQPLTAQLAGAVARLTVSCRPPVAPDQVAGLLVGDRVVTVEPAPAGQPASREQLPFVLRGFTAGRYVLRLRVDGQDSVPVATDGRTVDEAQTVVLT